MLLSLQDLDSSTALDQEETLLNSCLIFHKALQFILKANLFILHQTALFKDLKS